jgi:hypothetical protein
MGLLVRTKCRETPVSTLAWLTRLSKPLIETLGSNLMKVPLSIAPDLAKVSRDVSLYPPFEQIRELIQHVLLRH